MAEVAFTSLESDTISSRIKGAKVPDPFAPHKRFETTEYDNEMNANN